MMRIPILFLILATVLMSAVAMPVQAADPQKPPVATPPQTAPIVTEEVLRHAKEVLSLEQRNKAENLNQKCEGITNRLNQQDTRIGDSLTFVDKMLSLIGALGALIALGAVVSYVFSHYKAQAQVQQWVKEKGAKVLDKHIEDEVSKRMETFDAHLEERMKKFNTRLAKLEEKANEKLAELSEAMNKAIQDGNVSQEQVKEFNKTVEEIEEIPEIGRSFEEWHAIGIKHYFDGSYKKAADALQRAVESGGVTETEMSKGLFNRGKALQDGGQIIDAIASYDEVIRRFGQSEDKELKLRVAMALYNKGWTLNDNGQSEEAISTYQDVVDRFGQSEDKGLQMYVAMALYNKGVALKGSGQSEEAISTYQDVVDRFGQSEDKELQAYVAKSLNNKGVALSDSGQLEEAIQAYDDVERRFSASEDQDLREEVARAQGSRSFARIKMAKEKWQGGDGGDEARGLLSKAVEDATAAVEVMPTESIVLGNKAYALFLLGPEVEAEPIFKLAFEHGDEKFYKATLADAEIRPIEGKDEAFVEMIKSLWEEEKARRAAAEDKPGDEPKAS